MGVATSLDTKQVFQTLSLIQPAYPEIEGSYRLFVLILQQFSTDNIKPIAENATKESNKLGIPMFLPHTSNIFLGSFLCDQ
jgi:hypothetical protein